MVKVKSIKRVSDLVPDSKNANRGTERGNSLLEHSLRNYGAGRSILVDKNGIIIAGNKTAEKAVELGIDDAVVVPTDGKKLVVVQRTDLDIKDKAARELALADNRVAEADLSWDADVMREMKDDLDLTKLWSPKELEKLTKPTSDAPQEEAVLLDQAVQLSPQQEYVVVVCENADEFETLKERLALEPKRRGGYKKGSAMDAVGIERVIPAKRILARLK